MLAPSWEALGSFLGSWGGYGGQKIDPRWVLEGSWRNLGAFLGPSWPKSQQDLKKLVRWTPRPPQVEGQNGAKSIQNGSKIHSIFSLLLGSSFR